MTDHDGRLIGDVLHNAVDAPRAAFADGASVIHTGIMAGQYRTYTMTDSLDGYDTLAEINRGHTAAPAPSWVAAHCPSAVTR